MAAPAVAEEIKTTPQFSLGVEEPSPEQRVASKMSFEGHTVDQLWGSTSTMTAWYDRQRRKEAREVR